MTHETLQFGSPIATEVRDISQTITQKPHSVTTLGDLLDILGRNPPTEFPTLRTTCSRLADFLKEPIDQITVDSVNDTRDGFRAFLAGRKYKENAIRSYVNHARILMKRASELGWKPNQLVPEEWRSVLELAPKKKCSELAHDLSRLKKRPSDVSIEDVDIWVQLKLQQGQRYENVIRKKNIFWHLLRDCGCTEQTPLCILREKDYGMPLDQFPSSLKNEVLGLLKWKKAEFVAHRPQGGRHRKVTSHMLQEMLCGLMGFATNIRGETGLTSLPQLVQEQMINWYVEWRINERRAGGYGLQCNLRLLSAAMRQYPAYKSEDFSWFKPLIDSIPREPKAELKRKKAEKYLDYAVVETIPAKIRAEGQNASKSGIDWAARLAMEALVMKWLITLPWRQRNIRECRIGGPNPNLFYGKIPPYRGIDKPDWVKQQEQQDPAAEFWQFRFSIDETKTGIDVNALLPRQLIGPLEEYLSQFRHLLLRGTDPGTLFVNRVGNAMKADDVRFLVSTRTMQYGGRRVTPHLFRDIVAYAYLKEHPEDFLTLSKMLWHSNINTTIEIYGGRFNESSGVRAMESWLDQRESKSKLPASRPPM